MNRLRQKLTGLAAAFAIAATLTGTAMARHYYGSIAYSASTGAVGYIHDQKTKQGAIDGALQGCYRNADDCVTAINFWDGACGALAVGSSGGWGAGYGPDMDVANYKALEACDARDADCEIRRYQCTSAAR